MRRAPASCAEPRSHSASVLVPDVWLVFTNIASGVHWLLVDDGLIEHLGAIVAAIPRHIGRAFGGRQRQRPDVEGLTQRAMSPRVHREPHDGKLKDGTAEMLTPPASTFDIAGRNHGHVRRGKSPGNVILEATDLGAARPTQPPPENPRGSGEAGNRQGRTRNELS
jgi:hypothetical protein